MIAAADERRHRNGRHRSPDLSALSRGELPSSPFGCLAPRTRRPPCCRLAPPLQPTFPPWHSPKVTSPESRPSYLARPRSRRPLVFLLYLITLAPSTAMWDTSEYIAAAYVLGIPHPPGNPFFVLLGHVMSTAADRPAVAQRINIMAAACSAVSAGMWFLITERSSKAGCPSRWQRWVGASIAVLVGATAFTVWNQSVVNEKVYTVSLLFFAVVAWLTVDWCDDPDGPKADRLLILSRLSGWPGLRQPPGGLPGRARRRGGGPRSTVAHLAPVAASPGLRVGRSCSA